MPSHTLKWTHIRPGVLVGGCSLDQQLLNYIFYPNYSLYRLARSLSCPVGKIFAYPCLLSSAGSKTSSLISMWGVTENKGEESSLPSFQHWHHLGAGSQRKPDLALGSLHNWGSLGPLPCWGRQGLAACGCTGAHSDMPRKQSHWNARHPCSIWANVVFQDLIVWASSEMGFLSEDRVSSTLTFGCWWRRHCTEQLGLPK